MKSLVKCGRFDQPDFWHGRDKKGAIGAPNTSLCCAMCTFQRKSDSPLELPRSTSTSRRKPYVSHDSSLQMLRSSLDDLRHARLTMQVFCSTWRSQETLLADLPPRYREVMEDLLGRMEAGALFTEESCSFSLDDLQASLGVWLDKASQTLARS
jgi:hypothetical protein